MNNKTKLCSSLTFLIIVTMMLFVSIPPAKAQFVLASWDYPDEYGQGIESIAITENSTGSWLPGTTIDYDEASELDWPYIGAAIKLRVYTWFNSTFIGAIDPDDGKNYQCHNVTVKNFAGTTLFSKANFTYVGCYPSINPPLWKYYYDVILDFLVDYGEIYTVTVIYKIFW